MANPNQTVRDFRRKNPRPSRGGRPPDEEMRSVMDAVGRGDMTPEEGAEAVRKIMESRR